MIVLDTNVLSELVGGSRDPDRRVITWVRGLTEQPVTTALNRAELLSGIALLPLGRRRDALMLAIDRLLEDLTMCLPFNTDAAAAYAEIVAARTALGRPIATMDALIAGIAVVHDAAIATRDVDGFADTGLRVVDPWQPNRS